MKRRPSRNVPYYFLLFRVHSPCAILTAGILILMVTFVDLLRGGSHDLSSPPINVFPSSNVQDGRFRSVVEMPCICIRHDESSSLAYIPSNVFARFPRGVVEKGEARTTLEGISSFEHG